ncbi:hypothetical protein CEP52_011698 [Fusarium oligoseptatum]|uniref:Uncharacterized protein n=2 Tax=Fusarium solani species complex TaxID=232080 RepID=A0A428T2E0_9HYPO|nr:hypothetical protein CEP52_011698 [Fusarium oligoseptatum]
MTDPYYAKEPLSRVDSTISSRGLVPSGSSSSVHPLDQTEHVSHVHHQSTDVTAVTSQPSMARQSYWPVASPFRRKDT